MIIEIFSDLICPWCYIGMKRLDIALDSSVGEGIQTVWRAFQLYPGIPARRMSRENFLVARYGADFESGGSGKRTEVEVQAEARASLAERASVDHKA